MNRLASFGMRVMPVSFGLLRETSLNSCKQTGMEKHVRSSNAPAELLQGADALLAGHMQALVAFLQVLLQLRSPLPAILNRLTQLKLHAWVVCPP